MVATGEIMTMEHGPMIKCVMHRSTLSCPFCRRPLKPPAYKCKDGNQLACADCRGERQCQECDGSSVFNVRSTWADDLFTDVRAECRHKGCGLYITYYKLDDHRSTCLFVPCKCSMPGCGYEGLPPALTHHLSTMHLMPAHRIQYGKVLQLQVPVSERRRLLFMEEDGRVFLWSAARSAWTRLSPCRSSIRAGASPPSYYAANLWANGPPGSPNGRTDAIELEIEVTSSKEPDVIAVEELTFFTVPPNLLARSGSSRTVSLHIQIDKITS